MHILFVAFKYDYGRAEQGHSFEHNNFFDCLHNMGHDITYFDVGSLLSKYGRAQMNQRLLDVVKAEQPDLMFAVLFRDELDPEVIQTISDGGRTCTLNWFCDDHWRFDNY